MVIQGSGKSAHFTSISKFHKKIPKSKDESFLWPNFDVIQTCKIVLTQNR